MSILACPRCKGKLSLAGEEMCCEACGRVGHCEEGVVRFGVPADDASISCYQSVGGTRFHERMQIPYTTSSLDAMVYQSYLEKLKPEKTTAIIVDIGAGDGRNTKPWLTWGYRRVVALDAIFSALARFRKRLLDEHPDWLEHLLLVESDVRRLPIASDSADLATVIETLCYLNEDYESGLAECRRILRRDSRILLSDLSWEASLLLRLLYDGVAKMCELSKTRYLLDGPEDNRVRTRTFTRSEFKEVVERAGLNPLEWKGLSPLSAVCGYLRGEEKIKPEDTDLLPEVRGLLKTLGETGEMHRTHTVVAQKSRGYPPPIRK